MGTNTNNADNFNRMLASLSGIMYADDGLDLQAVRTARPMVAFVSNGRLLDAAHTVNDAKSIAQNQAHRKDLAFVVLRGDVHLSAAGLASVIRQTMTDARTDARTPRVWSDDPIATIWAIGYAIGVDMTVDSRDPIYRVGAVQGMGARGQCCHGAPCQFDDMASAIAHATNIAAAEIEAETGETQPRLEVV